MKINFGFTKARDEAVAEDYCNMVGKIRLQSKDDAMVASLINRQLIEMRPRLAEVIISHLKKHQVGIFPKIQIPPNVKSD